MKSYTTAHQFAFYTPLISYIAQQTAHLDIHEVTDVELVHRITTVLRLEPGESIILFDSAYHALATILGIKPKKSITIELHSLEPTVSLKPYITWLLPLLKRETFEEALYTLTELGAQAIQPLLTRKISRVWWSEKELVRSKKIMIAAAEQSKQYIIPHLLPLAPFSMQLLQQFHEIPIKLFFDPAGIQYSPVLARIQQEKPETIIACAGPEGDLTVDEKELLIHHNFIFCQLTKTVLRAQQAITLGLGILRTLL